jgi:hypothetical protein
MIIQDWLHVVDLGVAQDIIGNFFSDCIREGGLAGSNIEERLHALWDLLQKHYRTNKTPTKLDNLTESMLKDRKLHAKGAETRHLVPFCVALSHRMRGKGSRWDTIAEMFDRLHQIMCCMANPDYDHDTAGRLSREFCLLYTALEARTPEDQWRIKPKMHMMQEMLEYTAVRFGNPADFWTYTDERWGGTEAKAAKRRGGQLTPHDSGLKLLNNFRLKYA